MRLFEIADAEEQLALWKLVNNSVWAAIQAQQHEQAIQKAVAHQRKKSKRGKRFGKHDAQKTPQPASKLEGPNKTINDAQSKVSTAIAASPNSVNTNNKNTTAYLSKPLPTNSAISHPNTANTDSNVTSTTDKPTHGPT